MIYLPSPTARASRMNGLRHMLIAFFQTRARHRRDRKAFRNMLRLDDAMLRDIGVTRMDVERAADLPLSQSAAQELRRLSLMAKRQPR